MNRKLSLKLTRRSFEFVQNQPRKRAVKWGERLGILGYAISRRYREMAVKNLTIAYGDALSDGEKLRLTRGVFVHFGRALAEFLTSSQMTADEIRALVQTESFAPVSDAISHGKGVIFATAHLGNWELMGRRCVLEGFPLTVVARQSEDAAFNEITDTLRSGSGGYAVHPRGGSPKALLQQLKRGGAVGILPDQKSDDLLVPFFGQPAGTVAGPAVLALKTGSPILPAFCPRQPDGTYRIIFGDEIDVTPTGDTDADVQRIMTEVNCAIEAVVRRYPSQWLWLHDRWRGAHPLSPRR